MTDKVYSQGSRIITVAASESIAIFTTGSSAVYQKVGYPNHPESWALIGVVSNAEAVFGPFSNTSDIRIDAGLEIVLYATGMMPSISGVQTDMTAADSPFDIGGIPAAQGGAINVTGGSSSSAANAGGAANLKGGTPGATGAGGAANVMGGAGGSTSGAGGTASVSGGSASAGASAGGAAVVIGGIGNATGAGGSASITGGLGGNDAVGGIASISGGAAGGGNRAGGAATGTGGAGSGNAAGGVASMAGGIGGATGAGGASIIMGGAGGSSSGDGGIASLAGGAGTAGNSTGGVAIVIGGAGQGTANGAAGSLIGGASGAGATGNGADANVTGGSALSTAGNGGNVVLTPGSKTGSGINAHVKAEAVLVVKQVTPTAKTTAVTLTIAELLTCIITGTHSSGSTQAYTLPTGTNTDAGVQMSVDDGFDWALINLSAAALDTITLTASTGHTIVGNAVVQSANALTGALYGNSAMFRSRKTAANTFVTYRVS